MCVCVKYGIWNVLKNDPVSVDALCKAGFSPLTARVLCGRGYTSPESATALLRADAPLPDPFLLQDMDKAVERIRRAIAQGEHICVFGDYDVDGITATCLLTEFLRQQGAICSYYIPARIEEGYGLNCAAIESLAQEGVQLIITVDCGITASQEAELCTQLGMDLVITDHHECKESLPKAVAVMNPHRKDCRYPHRDLAGVGVAFKLAAALQKDQEAILDQYCDLLCLGTVADVMPLVGENRNFVTAGLKELARPRRVGLQALMRECGCQKSPVGAGTIGYILAPRINAAGRMGQVNLAVELFLTHDPAEAAKLASNLCKLNRERQTVESQIYEEAIAMLPQGQTLNAIVLASETWHQGVVGIVASRLAEEYSCPTFLICLDNDKGKASSRSHGGFNLFTCLESLSDLLESYGGHELAAGFTISRQNIEPFRQRIVALASQFQSSDRWKSSLDIDCAVEPELLTLSNIEALDQLEPCGAGCPRPVFYMDHVYVEQLSEVGGGKHLRMRLCKQGAHLGAIFFSTSLLKAGISVGDLVEIAFTPQINQYRGTCSVQLTLVDIRPDSSERAKCDREQALYQCLCSGQSLSAQEAQWLLPQRAEFVAVWKYLTAHASNGIIIDTAECLSRKISRFSGMPANFAHTCICLDVFAEQGLIALQTRSQIYHIVIQPQKEKVNLEDSSILQTLKQQTGGT